ncbi:serine/threonine protein kinase [Streptomyces acidicola]|uniref:non-specific serine/threonine protein kinase n=1 Tax=Streptomyces acidicola TaxID=2596892 RepID=A0A5N8X1H5_9ACTN|nr:serine/threonine-protein kinase [Streptomyces acidicola]MPY52876.1 serine/threonine protein kinase [Streptomyces acidicola]
MSGTNGDERGERETRRDDRFGGGIEPLTALDPARIGSYLLLGRLGAGGMGRVFLARSDGGRTVAVKVVHEEHVSDARFRARFRREIEAASRVAERYTAPVLDAGPDEEPPWVVTGYVPGLSLEQVVRGYGPLPAESLHTLANGLLRALEDIHDAGIVHRDLKPSNVMLTVDGVKVIDFGIARALKTSGESLLTSTGMVIGTPGFMSPEQVLGERAGPKSDVFTLGCVLTYAATGRLPFGHGAGNGHAVMYQIVQDEPDLEGVEDSALRALITRCLTKDAGQRPDVDELLADPERARPSAAGKAWLPADVLARIAQRAAELLDAEVRPLREESADRAPADLRPRSEPPVVVAPGSGGAEPKERERRPRRRRVFIALPVVVVLTAGGTTMVVLQPWSSDRGGSHAQAPGGSLSPTPDGSNSPGAPSGSPSKTSDGKDEKDKKDKKGKGSDGGKDVTNVDKAEGGSGSAGAAGGDTSVSGSSGSGDSSSGSSGSSGSRRSSSSSGSSAGSPPPDLKSYKLEYTHGCIGACNMPIKASWAAVSRATRYDIHYTNKGSNFTAKNVDTVYSTSNTSYTINGPFSGDEICITVRAANKYGASVWAETWCSTVPY